MMKMKLLIFCTVFLTATISGSGPATGSPVISIAESALSDWQTEAGDSTPVDALRIRPFSLDIIPPSSGVQFYRNSILFLSNTSGEEKMPERHLSFGLLRPYTTVIRDTLPGNYKPFDIGGTITFPSEATSFSADYNTMYISLIPDNSGSEKIFRAHNTPSGWKLEEKPLDICNGDYIYSHPALAADGSFMVFSSNMPGTEGGLDLFVTKYESGNWNSPENLGSYINSSGNELFASLDGDNNLYFSSDGLPGEGGYDIYVCRYNGSGWDQPGNLHSGINTKDDELAFTLDRRDDKTAFYTSRTRSGRSRTQLFLMDLEPGRSTKDEFTLSAQLMALATPAGEMPSAARQERLLATNAVKPVAAPEAVEKKIKEQEDVKEEITANLQEEKKERITEPKERVTTAATKEAAPTTATKEAVPPAPKKEELKSETPHQAVKSETPTQAVKKETTPTPEATKDVVIYRVQILANTKPAGSQSISVAGEKYQSFEYLYQGGYRTTIGEFGLLADAVRLQNLCRRNGYNQAFVVAFKNNVRSTDPALFK